MNNLTFSMFSIDCVGRSIRNECNIHVHVMQVDIYEKTKTKRITDIATQCS